MGKMGEFRNIEGNGKMIKSKVKGNIYMNKKINIMVNSITVNVMAQALTLTKTVISTRDNGKINKNKAKVVFQCSQAIYIQANGYKT